MVGRARDGADLNSAVRIFSRPLGAQCLMGDFFAADSEGVSSNFGRGWSVLRRSHPMAGELDQVCAEFS